MERDIIERDVIQRMIVASRTDKQGKLSHFLIRSSECRRRQNEKVLQSQATVRKGFIF